MAYAFIVVWGVGAVVIGSLFAFKPQVAADKYITQMARFRTSNRLRERLEPRAAILAWYRVAGVMFMILGILVPSLVFTGVLSMSDS